jgi:hypothetical protein
LTIEKENANNIFHALYQHVMGNILILISIMLITYYYDNNSRAITKMNKILRGQFGPSCARFFCWPFNFSAPTVSNSSRSQYLSNSTPMRCLMGRCRWAPQGSLLPQTEMRIRLRVDQIICFGVDNYCNIIGHEIIAPDTCKG